MKGIRRVASAVAITPAIRVAIRVASPERRGSRALKVQRGRTPPPAAHRLTERDRQISTMLSRHRVFTTDQLAEMYFDNVNTAQHRLTTLYKLRLVDRFRPLDYRYASLPYHYVLDELGAMVVAAERGDDPDKSRWRADKVLAIGKSQRLAHLVGVNGFFAALLAASRRKADFDLPLWWSERRCANQIDRIAQPDGC